MLFRMEQALKAGRPALSDKNSGKGKRRKFAQKFRLIYQIRECPKHSSGIEEHRPRLLLVGGLFHQVRENNCRH